MAAALHDRKYWQLACGCGHQRGYHTNDGTGSCAGTRDAGKAQPCEARCTAFHPAPQDDRIEKMYGPVPRGEPEKFLKKHCRHRFYPEILLYCTEIFSFADDGDLMCKVEFDGPLDEKTGRRPKLIGMHYAGNLTLAEDPETTSETGQLDG